MNTSPSPRSEAVFNIFRARNMFVADELRLRSLRALWREQGDDVDELDRIVAELRDAGYVDVRGDVASACLSLTPKGFEAMQAAPAAKPDRAAASVSRGAAASTGPAKPLRLSKPPQSAPAAAPAAAAAARPPRRAQPVPSPQGAADPLHLQILLALFKHLNVRPGGAVSRQGLAVHWSQMKLDYADLVRCVDESLAQGVLAPDSRDPGRVRLTTAGFAQLQAAPSSMEDARLRMEARSRVRALKQLGVIRQNAAG